MSFRALVGHLKQQGLDPDDPWTRAAVNSLIRELRHDLIEAFKLSEPLLDRYPSVFSESRSFLDFLITVARLPSYGEHRRVHRPRENWEACPRPWPHPEEEGATCRKALELCQKEWELCQKTLEQCQKERGTCQRAWRAQEKALEACQHQLREKEEALQHCQSNLRTQTSEWNDAVNYWDRKQSQYHTQWAALTKKYDACQNHNTFLGKELEKCVQSHNHQAQQWNHTVQRIRSQFEQMWSEKHDQFMDLTLYKDVLQEDFLNLANENSEIKKLLQKTRIEEIEFEKYKSIDDESDSCSIMEQDGEDGREAWEEIQQKLERCQEQLSTRKEQHETLQNTLEEKEARIQALEQTVRKQQVYLQTLGDLESVPALETCHETAQLQEKPFPDQETKLEERWTLKQDPHRTTLAAQLEKCIEEKQKLENDMKELKTKLEKANALNKTLKGNRAALDPILQYLTRYYQGHLKKGCSGFPLQDTDIETLYSHLQMDLEKLKGYNQQVDRLKKEAFKIHVTVETFADTVLDLHQQLPAHAKTLQALQKRVVKTNPKIRLSDADCLQKSVEWIEKVLQMTSELYDDLVRTQKTSFEFTDPKWVEWIRHALDTLHLFYTTVIQVHYHDITQDSDWFRKSVYWIDCYFKKFKANEKIIAQLTRLAQDLLDETSPNYFDWMEKFIERYGVFEKYVQSLLGCKPMTELTPCLDSLQLKAEKENIKESDWLWKYIEFLEDKFFSKRPKPYDIMNENLAQECTKLASQFNVSFDRDNFCSSIVTSQLYKKMMEASAHDAEMEKKWRDWDFQYKRGLHSFNWDPETTPEAFLERVRQRLEEWEQLYGEWLNALTLDTNLPKEQFLEKLNILHRLKTKRSSSPGASEESLEKKTKFDARWTHFEIQNLFSAMYKEYFTLKWRYLKNSLPTQDEWLKQVERKLEILEQIHSKSYEFNILLKVYTEYVACDLGLFSKRTDIFTNITSIHNLLAKSMEQTHQYLETLMEGTA